MFDNSSFLSHSFLYFKESIVIVSENIDLAEIDIVWVQFHGWETTTLF